MIHEILTEKRDGQNVIPLRQDGKTKWSLASAGMGKSSTQFLYGTHADKLAEYEAIGTVEELQKLKGVITDFPLDCGSPIKSIAEIWNQLKKYLAIGTIEEFKAYKLGDCMNDCEHYENCSNYIYSKGYDKAIDDFVNQHKEKYGFDTTSGVQIITIAEQLKGEKQ